MLLLFIDLFVQSLYLRLLYLDFVAELGDFVLKLTLELFHLANSVLLAEVKFVIFCSEFL